jgi:hypothetical protein
LDRHRHVAIARPKGRASFDAPVAPRDGGSLGRQASLAVLSKSQIYESQNSCYTYFDEETQPPRSGAKAMRLAHFLGAITEGAKFFIPIGHNPLKRHDTEK